MDIRLPTPRQQEISSLVWRIDELIEHRLLTLTFSAVTKGLRNTAEYQQTGIQWVGGVPKIWTFSPDGACVLPQPWFHRSGFRVLHECLRVHRANLCTSARLVGTYTAARAALLGIQHPADPRASPPHTIVAVVARKGPTAPRLLASAARRGAHVHVVDPG